MIYIGIDPGLDGGIAFLTTLNDGSLVGFPVVYDPPVVQAGKRRRYVPSAMAELIGSFGRSHEKSAFIERVGAMPEQGVVSTFNFGEGYGLWQGILAGLGVQTTLVSPQRWKGALLDGTTRDKGASVIRARELFPTADISLKKHHGRAEALLIAEYGRRNLR